MKFLIVVCLFFACSIASAQCDSGVCRRPIVNAFVSPIVTVVKAPARIRQARKAEGRWFVGRGLGRVLRR
jgi:hypothetical protein